MTEQHDWKPYQPPLPPHGLETERRLTTLEIGHGHHEKRLTGLEQSPRHELQTVDTPFGKLPLPLVLIVLLWLMARYPDHVLKAVGL